MSRRPYRHILAGRRRSRMAKTPSTTYHRYIHPVLPREDAMPIQRINALQLHYELHGDAGEPLVLVHGYTGDVTDWRFQLPEFSRTHRVLVIANRGPAPSAA